MKTSKIDVVTYTRAELHNVIEKQKPSYTKVAWEFAIIAHNNQLLTEDAVFTYYIPFKTVAPK